MAISRVTLGGFRQETGTTARVTINGWRQETSAGVTDTSRAPAAGTIVVSGQSPLLGFTLVGSTGTVVVQGLAPTLSLGEFRQPDAGAIVVGGFAPTLVVGTVIVPGLGAVEVSGLAPSLLTDYRFEPAAGSIVVAGQSPLLNLTLLSELGSIVAQGFAPTVVEGTAGDTAIVPSTGTIVVGGLAPSLLIDYRFEPVAGAVVVGGLAPTLITDYRIETGLGTIVVSGFAPSLLQNIIREPGLGTVVVTGLAPSLLENVIRQPDAGQIVVGGFAPTVGVGLPQHVYPTADIAANGWLPSTGLDLYAMLDETTADDADYIYSPSNPTTQQFEVKLGTWSDPGTNHGHAITLRLQAVNQDTSFDLNLVQGTTVLDSWTEAVTAGAVVERERLFAAAVIAGVTDRSDVRVRGVARAP